jgi:hypothetical protein
MFPIILHHSNYLSKPIQKKKKKKKKVRKSDMIDRKASGNEIEIELDLSLNTRLNVKVLLEVN